jgi:metal-sulfur cluster biosynthetic enzyme
MTLTTPMCPLGPYFEQEVPRAVATVPGVEGTRLNIVWSPPWDPSKMTDEAKLELGFW